MTTSHAKSFSIADEMAGFVNEDARKTTQAILARVILKTPKDEGEAQGSWQVNLSQPTRRQVSKKQRATEAARKGNRVIDSAKTLPYPTLVITSNKEYMERLNATPGHSEQQPNGKFVELSIQEVADSGIGN